MSVVQKVVFCEGKDKSLDSQLLQQLKPNDVAIVGAGGKFAFTHFAEGYFYRPSQGSSSSNEQNKKYMIFRDRDFDIEPTEQVQLLRLKSEGTMFLSHRTCIENYLLEPQLIHAFWGEKYREKQENPSSKWGHKDSPGMETISQWIEAAARYLKDYQAVRWALADSVTIGATRSQIQTTWMGNSGILPQSLTLQDCRNEALNLIKQFRTTISMVTESRFEEQLNNYMHRFEQEIFWSQRQYLVWFQGKDIQKQMQREKSQFISLSDFFQWAIGKIDFTEHLDLVELKRRVESL